METLGWMFELSSVKLKKKLIFVASEGGKLPYEAPDC